MEPKETMANVTPQKKVNPHPPHFLHADQIALIASMLDHFDGLAIATDGNGRIVYGNRSALQLSGFNRSEINGSSLEKLFDLTAKQQTTIKQCFDGKTATSFETTATTKSGATFAVQLKVAPLKLAAEGCGLAVFAVDVSGFKRTIEEQSRLVTAVENAAESIIVTDPTGKSGCWTADRNRKHFSALLSTPCSGEKSGRDGWSISAAITRYTKPKRRFRP
jgi:PAS domain S-box-containing protein